MTDRPIFVVGAQRSGTTLVRLLLDAHPNLAIGPETWFLKNVADGADRAAGTDRDRVREDGYAIGRDGIEAELAAAWARVFDAHAREQGAVRWGEKSPAHRYHGGRIKRLFPDAQIIAVVRHPAAVALSRSRWGYEAEKTAKDWGSSIRRHAQDAKRFGPRQFRLLRYEDLLADPRGTMASLLSFLGEPWDEAVMNHTAGVEEGTRTDGGTVMSDPLDPSRAFTWTEKVDADDLAKLGEQAHEQMAMVGYAADRDRPLLPLPDNDLTVTQTNPLRETRRRVTQRDSVLLARRAVRELRRNGVRSTLGKVKRRLRR